MTTDPTRLLEQSRSPLLRELLSAAREEQPSRAGLERTLLAVATTGALTAASASAAASAAGAKGASSGALLVAKWLGLGAIAGLATTTVALGLDSNPRASSPAASVAVVAKPSPAPRAVVAPSVAALVEAPAAPAATSLAAPPARPAASLARTSDAALAAELAALDAAKTALRAGSGQRALVLLRQYERDYPRGRLLPEALGLELNAFTSLGDPASARAVAQRIVTNFPGSPQALRARDLLASP